MAKFKLRLFRSCRSKDHVSTLPEHQPHRSSFKSHVSSAFGCGSKSGDLSDSDYFQWQQDDDQWHVVAKIYDLDSPRRKIYNSSVSSADTDDEAFPLPLLPADKNKRRHGRRRLKLHKLQNIDVGAEDETETETETLISSSRSFSTDSSTDFNPQLETIRESAVISLSNRSKLRRKRTLKRVNNGGRSPEWGSPARLSVFEKLIPCEVEGKVKESFAVVKRTEDPYEDFKRSMMEMIMEKEMFEESDLEQLLQCYLSLNSRVHHGMIVEAFSEIWDAIFAST